MKRLHKSKAYYVEALKRKLGACKIMSAAPRPIELGPFQDGLEEFRRTIDDYRVANGKMFLSNSEYFEIMLYLGYRKVASRAEHIDKLEA